MKVEGLKSKKTWGLQYREEEEEEEGLSKGEMSTRVRNRVTILY